MFTVSQIFAKGFASVTEFNLYNSLQFCNSNIFKLLLLNIWLQFFNHGILSLLSFCLLFPVPRMIFFYIF